MEKLLFRNVNNAKWVIAACVGAHSFWWFGVSKPVLHNQVFGQDGNGGSMLKIITDLTDEEMARLKHNRRMMWHWRGNRQNGYGKEKISDQELSDRGIKVDQEPYVEYIKRPPHDKYL
jgi:hypothetical protein